MTDVFISYAREDAAQADRIARGLEAMGLGVFWDNEVPPGQTWADYIEGKLNQCAVAIVLWSANSTKSQWVREEARMGRGKLIPARLDAVEAPFGFGDVQAADLSRWNGDYTSPDWRRFADAVFARARGDAAPTRRAPPQPQTPSPQQAAWSGAQSGQQSGGDLSPIGYIQKCLRLYIVGKGRARRKEYGWFFVFYIAAIFAGAVLDVLTGGINPYTGAANSQIIVVLTLLALAAPLVSASSRRAHDFGQSGWLALLTVIPYLGFLVVLLFIFIPGQAGPNQHGPDPKAAPGV